MTLQTQIYHLRQQIWQAKIAWHLYDHSYRDREMVALMNARTSFFFGNLQKILFDAITLWLLKLVDKDRRSISLERLVNEYQKSIGTRNSVIDANLVAVLGSLQELRTYRNKRVAHLDATALLNPQSLPALTHEMLKDAFVAIENLFDSVTVAYDDSSTAFDLGYVSGVAELKQVLSAGLDTLGKQRLADLAKFSINQVDG